MKPGNTTPRRRRGRDPGVAVRSRVWSKTGAPRRAPASTRGRPWRPSS